MATKEHPILFSGPLVRAILSGQKTQTRRLFRVHPKDGAFYLLDGWPHRSLDGHSSRIPGHPEPYRCPYGKPGDRLWVRETWAMSQALLQGNAHPEHRHVIWKASYGDRPDTLRGWEDRWRPSIHMPRWASRISLEVTEVRVQRLRDITDEDACAEGVTPDCRCEGGCDTCSREGVDYFRDVWEALAPDGSKWADNPWVWAVSFKMVQP